MLEKITILCINYCAKASKGLKCVLSTFLEAIIDTNFRCNRTDVAANHCKMLFMFSFNFLIVNKFLCNKFLESVNQRGFNELL